MQAIILAAGMGKRLGELTKRNTKCMVTINGVSLIERMLEQLERLHLSRIIIVVGFEGRSLIEYIDTINVSTPIFFVNNPYYNKTNNIYSLSLAKDYLAEQDTLLLESDLIFDYEILDMLIRDPRDTLALVDKYESWMDGTVVKLKDDDSIETFIPGNQLSFNDMQLYYKTVNIYKFSKSFSNTHYIPFLMAYRSALGENQYYEQVLRVIAMLDEPAIWAKRLSGQRWYEIDDLQDLDIARSIFTPNEDDKVRLLSKRYGGYWRFPKLLDFCYLVNPFFPPERMMAELRANLDALITAYPSGMQVNSLLAAKSFGVSQQNILVGNGAAELIKNLMGCLEGKIGFIRPTFEEYPRRYERHNSVNYYTCYPDYSYSAEDIISFFETVDIANLVLVNPDNPTGNYIPRNDLLKLIAWSDKRGIRLVVDESFVDFADEENTLLKQNILAKHPLLCVIKSISKSYGVPGLRLGVLASGDLGIIEAMKEDASLWNINSLAEFYMQIEEKYRKDYQASLVRMRIERNRFQKELSKINGIRVVPSQANFVMVELDTGITSTDILKRLLVKHNMLVKDLTVKTDGRKFLRLAIRGEDENDMLIAALASELEGDS